MLESQSGTPNTAANDIQFSAATYDFDDLSAPSVQAGNADLASLAVAIGRLATPEIAPPPPRISAQLFAERQPAAANLAEAAKAAAPVAAVTIKEAAPVAAAATKEATPEIKEEAVLFVNTDKQERTATSTIDWQAMSLALDRSLQSQSATTDASATPSTQAEDEKAPPAAPAAAFSGDNSLDWDELALSLDALTAPANGAQASTAAADAAEPSVTAEAPLATAAEIAAPIAAAQSLPSTASTDNAAATTVAPAASTGRKTSVIPQIYHFKFTGSGSEYFRIWIVNLVLSILTLGIYSAWAKVRTTRYFYGCTRLGGSSFQYLADPKAILRSRILAVAILGLFALCFAANYLLSFVSDYLLAATTATVALMICPWLVVAAMIFKLRNSAWRGCRFDFLGHYHEGLLAFTFSYLLNLATAGLSYPWWFQHLKRYLTNNTAIGGYRFNTKLSASPIYGAAFRPLFALLALIAACAAAAVTHPQWLPTTEFLIPNTDIALPSTTILVVAAAFLLFAASVYAYAYWRSHSRNLVLNTMTLDGGQFYSGLQAEQLFSLYMGNCALLLFTLGLAWPWTQVRLARYYAESTDLVHKDLDGMMVAAAAHEALKHPSAETGR